MKILLLHNYYKIRGGEDNVYLSEKLMLEKEGIDVSSFTVDNLTEITNKRQEIKTFINLLYSNKSKLRVYNEILRHRPTIVHVHNYFPILTPAIFDACISACVPVVQTLHNFRAICPGGLLLRDGKICEKCINGWLFNVPFYRCYRRSIIGSFALASMVAYHRGKKTWQNKVNRFIALTHFEKKKYIDAGFPESKIIVKPNCYYHIAEKKENGEAIRKDALFVGRISKEKGIETLLEAWKLVDYPLVIVGEGHTSYAEKFYNDSVKFAGRLNLYEVSQVMTQSAFLIMPSEWYETFGLVIIEAFAHHLPVIASKHGAMEEIIEDGYSGIHFKPGDPLDLAEKAKWMFEHPDECRRMGENARKEYEAKYTPEINYQQLMAIYQEVIEEHKRGKLQHRPNS